MAGSLGPILVHRTSLHWARSITHHPSAGVFGMIPWIVMLVAGILIAACGKLVAKPDERGFSSFMGIVILLMGSFLAGMLNDGAHGDTWCEGYCAANQYEEGYSAGKEYSRVDSSACRCYNVVPAVSPEQP